jgi:Bax protein
MKRRTMGKLLESLLVRGIELIYSFFESDFFADSLNLIQKVLTGIFGAILQACKRAYQSKTLRQLLTDISTILKNFWVCLLKSIPEIIEKLKTHPQLPHYRDKFYQLCSSIKGNPKVFGPAALILLMIIFWPNPSPVFIPEIVPEIVHEAESEIDVEAEVEIETESVVNAKSEPTLPKKEISRPILDIFPTLPNFSDFAAGSARKNAFFSYFLPLIGDANQSVVESRELINNWYQNRKDLRDDVKRRILNLASYYRLQDFDPEINEHWDRLFSKVNLIPPSLALAQAANESAWGTSRFARKGNNFYGQWCFEPGCGLVPAKRDSNKKHEVAAFKSPKESVNRYIHNLNSHPAYRKLRKIRQQLEQNDKTITGYDLAAGLDKYSERGQEYIKELRAMITYNKLDAYDKVIGQGK